MRHYLWPNNAPLIYVLMIKFWILVCIVIAAQVSFPSIAAEAHAAAKAKNIAEDVVADIDGVKHHRLALAQP